MSKEENIKLSEKQKDELLSELIFDITCLGCGKVSFNLPYKKDTYHTMTCQQCGEVTIAHILTDGSIACATESQKQKAIEKLSKKLFESVKPLFYSYCYSYQHSFTRKEMNWRLFHKEVKHMDTDAFISVKLVDMGLCVSLKSSCKYHRNDEHRFPDLSFPNLEGLLDLENNNAVKG